MANAITDYDRRQYQRMRGIIAAYEQGRHSFHNLIADLESLARTLETVPQDWHQAFTREWETLERVHATAFVVHRTPPSVFDEGVQNALTNIKSLLASVPKLPCPCCGFPVFDEPPGSYDNCPICAWEDDDVQLRFPDLSGGANKPSLIEAQRTFAECGSSDTLRFAKVRPPAADELRDAGWRPIEPKQDLFKELDRRDGTDEWPAQNVQLYYWRPDFWRSKLRA
jgi:hypothetical protein